MKRNIRGVILIAIVCISYVSSAQSSRSGNLSAHVDSIISSLPGSGTNQYAIPTSTQGNKWESVISKIISHNYSGANTTASPLGYRVVMFTDTIAPVVTYVVLEKNPSGTNYWGTYIFNASAQRSNLVIQSPHPRFDTNTDKEGFYIFKNVSAFAFCLAGTHRCNSSTFSTCSGTTDACGTTEAYRISDIAHEVNGAFQRTTKQIVTSKPTTVFMQMHGFAKLSGDPDLILGNGTTSAPSSSYIDYLLNFKNNLSALDASLTFKVAHIDVNWTRLTGTTNTQGRYINGIKSPCNTSATVSKGRFLHVEQAYTGLRDNATSWQKVSTAIANTFPIQGSREEGGEIAINGESENSFSVFPNPASSTLTLESLELQNGEIKISNLLGKIERQEMISFNNGKADLNISELKPGIHFIELQSGNRLFIQKFIKR